MAMNKSLLYNKVKNELIRTKKKLGFDLELVLYLIEKTIFNDPKENCIIKGKKEDWAGLPQTKSLFYAQHNCGLPIGNLTSQLFGNIYMNEFDHWVKRVLGIKQYGRYVDDFVLIHESKDYLQSIIPKLSAYLLSTLELTLHPDKIYLQHYSKGVKYLGAVIKPHKTYIANRTKGNFYNAIEKQNQIARDHSPRGINKSNFINSRTQSIQRGKPTKEEQQAFQSSMNSYLEIIHPVKSNKVGAKQFNRVKHYNIYKLRKQMILKNLSGWWWNYVYLSGGICKFEMKTKII
jgi:hypothetical protein